MIADAKREMPPAIRNDADQRYFQDGLDHAAVVVHGRHSHEGGPRAARRKRLILTRRVGGVAPDSAHPNALLWNRIGSKSVTASSPSSAAPKCSVYFCPSTTLFTFRGPQMPGFRAACRYSAKSVLMPRRKRSLRAMASNLGCAAISIPPPE